MDRNAMLQRLRRRARPWDVLIIGGGATGLGCAIDAAARGYDTLLVEQFDFAKGTSSRSTKLAHGGVRYLQQGNVSLVVEALRERGLMRRNAPHLVHDMPFVVPNYAWWEAPFFGVGLRVYDVLAGKLGFGRSRNLSRAATLERIPTVETTGLRGGVIYYDGQFDDARLAINLAQTAAELGATLVNYCRVVAIHQTRNAVDGAVVADAESGERFEPRARVVINAAGVWGDAVRELDLRSADLRSAESRSADVPSAAPRSDKQPNAARPLIAPSQGSHIVLDRSFLPGDSAIMVPRTEDGRVLFAIPWQQRVLIGTTDVAVDAAPLEPRPMPAELDFLLGHAARYLSKDPGPSDVLSAFAGLRPLVRAGDGRATSALSRDHLIHISTSGLVTIAGGKWTTYRKMAEDAIDQAASIGGLEMRPCPTRDLPIHGHCTDAARYGPLAHYGSDAPAVRELINSEPHLARPLHPRLPYLAGEVIWAARREMARTVEDVLARRTRALVLDARAAQEAAPTVAALLAAELKAPDGWAAAQVAAFNDLAAGYIL